MLERGRKILVIGNAIDKNVTESDWIEIGFLTNSEELIKKHPRLLRSLSWGDDDYKGHVFELIGTIIDAAPENLGLLVDFEPIGRTIEAQDPGAYAELRCGVVRGGSR